MKSVEINVKGRWFFKKGTSKVPFGMTMPGRSYNAHTYRHGFTGHEKESDLAEGIYTTEYRLYDARVGMWLSVDPLSMDNAGESPYLYCSGMPMTYFDPDGRVKRDKNGEVIFKREKRRSWFFFETVEVSTNDKGEIESRTVIAVKAKKGKIYLNDGSPVEAYKTDGRQTVVYELKVNKDGEVLSSNPVLDGMNPNYNCTGKIADRNFLIDASEISMNDLIYKEGYKRLNKDEKPQIGDIGVYVDNEGNIVHYELYIDNVGNVDAKGGYENDRNGRGGEDTYWKNTDYIILRLNNQDKE